MRFWLKIGLSLAALLGSQSLSFARPPKRLLVKLSDCKIYSSASAYGGIMVRIRAAYGGSFEGSSLYDTNCKKGLWFTTPEGVTSMAAVYTRHPGSFPKVADPNFSLVKDAEYAKFTRFAGATVENLESAYDVTATFTGRLDRCRDFKMGKDGFGNGFGHMGASEYQFVLQSVSEIDVQPVKDPVETIPSKLPDHISEQHYP